MRVGTRKRLTWLISPVLNTLILVWCGYSWDPDVTPWFWVMVSSAWMWLFHSKVPP